MPQSGIQARMPASIGSNQASPANSAVPSACVFVLFSSMAWSPPALERRKWFVEQTRDYATNLFPPPSLRHPFKRQVAEEFIAGETLHALSKRHDISRQLVRIWVGKFEAGALDDDVQAADLIQEYEAKIAALERMVGRQALELELLKGALRHLPRPRSASTSVVTGPAAFPLPGGAS